MPLEGIIFRMASACCGRVAPIAPWSVGACWDHERMDTTSNAADVARILWERMQARNWDGAAELLDPGVVVEWPVSRERMNGRGNFIAVNREYPEGWEIRVLRVVGDGDQAVSEVEVVHQARGLFRAASFWTVAGGLITRGTEYWTEVGSEEPQTDRSRYVERY
jgi:SnoaL-like domain